MKITTLDRNIADVFKDFLFIPRFQRPYSWEKEQVEQFWSDTILDNKSEYFIGSVVLYKQGAEWGLVDGQQRLTTALLVLCALRNAFEKHHMRKLAEAIQRVVERSDFDAKERFVLRTETSAPFLQDRILRWGAPELDRGPSDEEKLLDEMFQYLTERIEDAVGSWPKQPGKGSKAETVLRTIRDRLLNLKLITVELDNEDDAYLVFETLNTRGKDLQVSHLVKNHLSRLMKANNKALDALKIKWAKILETFSATQADLEVDAYLHHFWLSRSKEYVTSKKLFASFKKATNDHNAKQTLDALLKDATLYRQIVESSFGKWKREDEGIRGSLYAISQIFRMRQPYPLLLSAMRCYRDGVLSKKNVESVLRSVECFHFAFTAVAQKSSSGGISFMYAAWAQKLTNAKSEAERQSVISDIKKNLRKRMPKKDDFVAGFRSLGFSDDFTRQKKLVKYVLAHVEDHLSKSGVAVDYDKMTIEHVAPQSPVHGAPPVSEARVAMLGNLLLCDVDTQDKLKNHSFEKKKPILKGSGIAAAREIAKHAAWGEAEIVARTDELASLAYDDIWKL